MVSEFRGSIILKFNAVSAVLYVVLGSFIRRHIPSGLPFGNFRSYWYSILPVLMLIFL